MAILSEQLKEQRMYAEAQLKNARNFNRFITVKSIGIEPLELGGQTIECLKVYYEGVYGYIPKDRMDDYEFRSLYSFVNGEFQVTVETIISDDHDTFFIGNRKAALQKQEELFWKSAKKGQLHNAFVSGVDKTNLYLIVNGVRIRMPKEEYSYSYHHDLREVVAIGETMNVCITSINNEEQKLEVSRRVLEVDPSKHLSQYKVGGVYACEINNIDFERASVFVTLEPHGITALAKMPALRIGQHLKVGDKQLSFKVNRVDLDKGHIFGHIIVPKVAQIAKARRSW